MANKKIIIIGLIMLIIISAILFVMLTSMNYERIYITPNGTNIEVPANQTKYAGKIDSVKIWNWDRGILVTYNSNENYNLLKINELCFNTVSALIKNGEKQDIDGFTCYVINADELLKISIFDIIKVNYDGKFYCIPLSNETSHDNIIICSKDKDVAIHMAKSVVYKNVYPNIKNLNNTISEVEKITGEVKSKINDYTNNTALNDIKSTIKEKVESI